MLWEKKHCYKKHGWDIYCKSNYANFFVTSPRFLDFSKELAQFIVTTCYIYSFISRKKSLKVVNHTLSIGFWQSLTCQNSHVNFSSLGRLDWLIFMHCSQKTFHFLSVSDGPTSTLSDIAITLRKSHKIKFVTYLKNQKYLREMFVRRLRDVKGKISFLRCIWDVLKTSQKRYLFWGLSERSLRYLSQWRSDWDLSETSHTNWKGSEWKKTAQVDCLLKFL